MTFRLSLLIDANAQDAKVELGAVSKAANQAGNSVQKMGQQESRAAASTRGLTTAAGAAEAQIRSMAAANQLAANTNRQLADSQVMAAGSVANLTAQFNDIGVMMASGQNPLQLALQQGTQITQVFGQAGAGAAIRSLGAAFMSMLSPLNLITIGTIAAGGALVNWLTRADEDAETLEERLEDVVAAAKAAQQELRAVRLGVSDDELPLRDEINRARENVARLEAELPLAKGAIGRGNKRAEIAEAREELAVLEQRLALLRDTRDETARLGQEVAETANIERLLGEQMLAAARGRALEELRANEAGRARLATMQAQNGLAATALIHGRDSVEVARVRAAQEYQATRALIEGLGVSEDLKRSLLGAAANAYDLAQADIASTISAGATEAERLANALGIAVSNAIALSTVSPQMADEDAAMAQQVLPTANQRAGHRNALQNFARLTKPQKPRGGGRRGGAGKSSAGELSASRELIKSLEQELALLREKDPLQKELLRNSEALAEATNAERRQISDLIAEKLREERATRAQTEAAEEFGRIGYEAIDSLIFESGSLADALENVTESLGKAALQASLLGTGPFANMFGGSEGGGVFGMILGSIFPKAQFGRAEGGAPGPVYGRGSATSDDVPAWLSQSEFVMNGQATRRYRHILEAMNGGGYVPGFASGGPVGAANAPWAPQINFSLSVENTSSHPVDARLEQDQSQGPGRAMRLVLSDQVGAALAEPNGGAHKTLRRNFGIRQRGTVR